MLSFSAKIVNKSAAFACVFVYHRISVTTIPLRSPGLSRITKKKLSLSMRSFRFSFAFLIIIITRKLDQKADEDRNAN